MQKTAKIVVKRLGLGRKRVPIPIVSSIGSCIMMAQIAHPTIGATSVATTVPKGQKYASFLTKSVCLPVCAHVSSYILDTQTDMQTDRQA